MEINTKPPVLKAQEAAPNLVTFMQKAVEDSINRQLDENWGKDRPVSELAGDFREPTVTKISSSDFYEKVACALMKKQLERKLKA